MDEAERIEEQRRATGRSPLFKGGATDPRLPDLYFLGYSNPISGNLRELGIDARRIARSIDARHS